MIRTNGVRLGARGKGYKPGGRLPLSLLSGIALVTLHHLITKKSEGKGVRLGARGNSIHHHLHGLAI